MANDAQTYWREFRRAASDTAFAALVRAQVDLVHATALRRVGGDGHAAQDIAQTVFADLHRKAGRIPLDTPIAGWLYRHTCFVSGAHVRREQRRKSREQEAARMSTASSAPAAAWEQLAPVLDAALNRLSAHDRDALVLRYFENRDLRSVGALLGVGEDAAQKRVRRALDRLRRLLGRRGVNCSTAGLGATLAAHAVHPAPAAAATVITEAVLAGTATATGGWLLLHTIDSLIPMNWLKPLALAGLAGALATPLVLQQRTIHRLERDQGALVARAAAADQWRLRQEELAARLAAAHAELAARRDQEAELMRLRGEVTRLREERAGTNSTRAAVDLPLETDLPGQPEEPESGYSQVLVEGRMVSVPLDSDLLRVFNLSAARSDPITRLLDTATARLLLEKLEVEWGIATMFLPRLSTLSGRETTVSLFDQAIEDPVAQQSLVPKVHLRVTPTVVEHENGIALEVAALVSATTSPSNSPIAAAPNSPLSTAEAKSVLGPGQVMLLAWPHDQENSKVVVLTLITPRLIDATGEALAGW